MQIVREKKEEKVRYKLRSVGTNQNLFFSMTGQQIAVSNEGPLICYHANKLLSHKGTELEENETWSL